MSSRRGSYTRSLDLLITEALQAQVGDMGPSPYVWRRIRRQAESWAAHHRPGFTRPRNPVSVFLSRADVFFSFPVSTQRDLSAWRYDLVAMRLLGHGGIIFRLGW